jgi:hypothetical protein
MSDSHLSDYGISESHRRLADTDIMSFAAVRGTHRQTRDSQQRWDRQASRSSATWDSLAYGLQEVDRISCSVRRCFLDHSYLYLAAASRWYASCSGSSLASNTKFVQSKYCICRATVRRPSTQPCGHDASRETGAARREDDLSKYGRGEEAARFILVLICCVYTCYRLGCALASCQTCGRNAIVTVSQAQNSAGRGYEQEVLSRRQVRSMSMFCARPFQLGPPTQYQPQHKINEGARLQRGRRHPSISSEQATALFVCLSKPRVMRWSRLRNIGR